MDTSILVPALAFGTLLAVLWFGVMGVKSVKKEKREGETFGDSSTVESNRSAGNPGVSGTTHADFAEPISKAADRPVEMRDPDARGPGKTDDKETVRIGERGRGS